jgi:hypothetical protein
VSKNSLEKLFREMQPDPLVEPKPEDAVFQEESIEEPSGDGRTSRHQILGLEVEDSEKDLWFFPYGCLMPCKLGKVSGQVFTFVIACDDTLSYELVVEGPISAARRAIDKLCSGKRELLRANQDSITAIRVKEIRAEKEA